MTTRRVIVASVLLWAAALLAGCASTDSTGPRGSGTPSAGRQDPAAGPALPDSAAESETQRRARIRMELAAGYYGQRNLNVALEEIRQSLAIDPDYAPSHGLLGIIYMDMGDRARAEESFQRALRLAPNDSEITNNYGWFLCQTGRERESLELFNRAARNPLYQTPAKPLHNAGICSLRMGDQAGAEGYFQRSFQVDPRNAVAMYNLAEIGLKRRDFERARFYSQRLLSVYEPTAETLWQGVRIERAAGNRDAEASYASQLRRRFPQSRETSMLLSGQYGQ